MGKLLPFFHCLACGEKWPNFVLCLSLFGLGDGDSASHDFTLHISICSRSNFVSFCQVTLWQLSLEYNLYYRSPVACVLFPAGFSLHAPRLRDVDLFKETTICPRCKQFHCP